MDEATDSRAQVASQPQTGCAAFYPDTLLPLLLCMTVVVWMAFSADPHYTGNDFIHVSWVSARLILEGQNPYSPDQQEVRRIAGDYIGTLLAADGKNFTSGPTYYATYPYWALLLTLPLGLFSYPVALIIWSLINGILLLAGLYLAFLGAQQQIGRALPPPSRAMLLVLGLAALLFAPALLHFYQGQYSIIIFFLLALLYAALDRSSALIALPFALATMKPQLSGLALALIFVGWLAAVQWRKVVAALVALALLYMGPMLVAPGSMVDWFSVTFLVQKQATRNTAASSSWWGLAYAWTGHWWVWVAGALSLLTLALLIRPVQRAIAAKNVATVLPLAIIVTLMITPYTLGYDQVLLLLPFAWLWLRLQDDERTAARLLRYALLLWLTLLPLLQVELVDVVQSNYIRVIQTLALLGLYYAVTRLKANPTGVLSYE